MKIPVHTVPDRSCKAKGRAKSSVVAYATVDAKCAHLAQFFWTLRSGYAARRQGGRCIFMHHDVIGRQPGHDVSHINGNKLDNRSNNLKHATRSENMLNPADGPTSALKSNNYRGVTRDDKRKKLARPWRGKVTVMGKTHQTKRCSTPEEARDALVLLRKSLRVREWPVGVKA